MLAVLSQVFASASVACPTGESCAGGTGLPMVTAGSGELQTILQIVFGIAAALAVLFIVIGGLRFVLSAGSSENVTKARETILYAVIGLVIALIAEGIVTFVIKKA